MSIIGILSSNLFASGAAQSAQNTQAAQNAGSNPSKFQQIKTEFQQLGQDLQAGNLSQAQADYTSLSQNVPGLTQSQNAASPLAQAFQQLGQDLQSGNLQAARGDYSTVQQDTQQAASQARGHHHHHHAETSQESGSNQEQGAIQQAFSQLAQSLQAGSLSGAQSAFATLQNDLQQIGGFLPGFSSGDSGSSGGGPIPAASGSVSVSA